jgi:hypothetical protein
LLQSSDFLSTTISKVAKFGDNKDTRAVNIAEELRYGNIEKEDILLEFCKQPRQWFSYKLGKYGDIPEFKDPSILLTEFGEEGWYGPIYCEDEDVYYYIRTYKFRYYTEDGDKNILINNIRWSLIAKVSKEHISCYWNGFSTNQKDKINSHSQFQFWNYIPDAFNELEDDLEGDYRYEVVHDLILRDIWKKYIHGSKNEWRHLAVRAEASGVNLCARSKGITEINVKGLLSLASKISQSLIKDIYPDPSRKKDKKLLKKAENSVLKTLIHSWGTKSYEFSIDHDEEKLFKSHCYFGLKPESQTQDCFPHFKCFRAYGGPSQTFEFLLEHSKNSD